MEHEKLELCKFIESNIYKLGQTEIDEIFKILHTNNSTYTKNNNGVFVNLNWLETDIIQQLHDYVTFCIKSQTEIHKYELMKNILNDSMTNKEKNDDEISLLCNNTSNIIASLGKQTKISSSMKFYLLKKKFLKKNANTVNHMNNVLNYEEYIIN
jgi:hypothetical protein